MADMLTQQLNIITIICLMSTIYIRFCHNLKEKFPYPNASMVLQLHTRAGGTVGALEFHGGTSFKLPASQALKSQIQNMFLEIEQKTLSL